MAQPIFSDLTSNPVDTRVRMAPQATLDTPNMTAADYVQAHIYGGTPAPPRGEIEDQVLAPDGNPLDALPGKWGVEGGPLAIGTVDPANLVMLMGLGNLFERYDFEADTPVAGVNRWTFGRSATTAVHPYCTLQVNNQITQITSYAGVLFTGLNIGASPNSPYFINLDYLWNHWHEFGDIAATSGTPTLPTAAWGEFDEQWDPIATDNDVYIEFQGPEAAGLIPVKVKIGAAAVYGGTTQQLVAGRASRLRDETGARIGDFGGQMRILFPTGGTYVLSDEIVIPRRRTPWAESIPVRRPISSIWTTFIVDDEEIRVPQGFNITAAWDAVINEPDTGGSQGAVLLHGGALAPQIELTRPVLDLLFQKGLRTGSTVRAVVDSFTKTKIGATVYEYRTLVVMPRCQVTGALFGTQPGGRERNESPVLIGKTPEAAYTYDGMNFSDPISIVVENDAADLTQMAV